MSTDASTIRYATGHVGINVTDIEQSKRFYQEVFGWQVQGESTDADRRFAFLGDEEQLMITLWQQSEGRFDKRRPGLHHLSFEVDGVEEVQEAERRVRSLGATIYHDGIVSHSERSSSGGIFFEDPDGTRLEIYAPSGVGEFGAPSGAAPTCGFF